ncbi:MAG: hypothetical protein NVS1B4_17750 [Gemmatimonadaceae bacterium]
MSWQPLDCHAHTTFSDGELEPSAVVDVVRARGVRPSIADHISTDVRGSIKSVSAARAYLDELARHDVMRGGEFCWHDGLWRELPPDLARRFSHRLGSLHAILLPDGSTLHAFWSKWPSGLTPDDYMDALMVNLERLGTEMPVDILAHPTLLPVHLRERDLHELWTEVREERAVDALLRANIAFEVSNRYRPHRRFVERAAAAGVRLSLGSDGHSREQVGEVAWPLAIARDVGVADADLYDPAVHGSKTSST